MNIYDVSNVKTTKISSCHVLRRLSASLVIKSRRVETCSNQCIDIMHVEGEFTVFRDVVPDYHMHVMAGAIGIAMWTRGKA